ncbi:MAG: cupin domain-containing protein [Chloroflexia bacterium]
MTGKMSEERPVRASANNIKRRALVIAAILAPLLTGNFIAGTALATPGNGVTSTPIADGVLPVPIRVKLAERPPHGPGRNSQFTALSHIGMDSNTVDSNTMEDGAGFGNGLDVSNISIVKNIVAPGGYFGWHQHSGPSWIVVTRGTLTFYYADDPSCAGQPVSAGGAYLDMGTHTHNARNETSQPVENYVVRMLPQGGAPRIDKPDPGVCPF